MAVKYTDISLDIETMGVTKRAVIRSIGATFFNIETGDICPEVFYKLVDEHSCLQVGLEIDKETVDWWARQSTKAKQEFEGVKLSIREALEMLSKDIQYHTMADKVRVWGKGPGFDNAIVEEAYKLCGMPLVWKYYNDMDFRTLNLINKKFLKLFSKQQKGIEHSSAGDSFYQAEQLIEWWQKLTSLINKD